MLAAKSLGTRDLSLLVSDAVAGLLLLVVLLDEGDLLATESALEVVDALGNSGELVGEILLVLLDLLDLKLDEVGGAELGQFLRKSRRSVKRPMCERKNDSPRGRP